MKILSPTQGVDFGPYWHGILPKVRRNWYAFIPASVERKTDKLAIEFAVTKSGAIADLRLAPTSGDVELDRIAWRAITTSSPFPALPAEFKGAYL